MAGCTTARQADPDGAQLRAGPGGAGVAGGGAAGGRRTDVASPAAACDPDDEPDDRIEIVLPDGTAVRVVTGKVSTTALRRVLTVLRG